MTLWWWLLGLAVAGCAISLYFTLIYFERVAARGVPAVFCRREEQTCVTILRTPYARLFGVPNALLGVGFYLLAGTAALLALAGRLPEWLWLLTLGLAAASVLLAPYLIWALVARLKSWCGL